MLSNRNILVTSVFGTSISFLMSLYLPWIGLYWKELYFPMNGIGLSSVHALGSVLMLLGGVLADKYGRRKLILLGTTFSILYSIIPLFSKSLLSAIAFWSIISAIAAIQGPSMAVLVAESLPQGRRGTGFGVLQLLGFPTLFLRGIGGVLVERFGIVPWVRTCILVHTALNVAALVLRYRFITETLRPEKHNLSHQAKKGGGSLSELVGLFKTWKSLFAMMVSSWVCLFALRLFTSYITVYVITVTKLTMDQRDIISNTMEIVFYVLVLLGGVFADRFGRRPGILLGAATSVLTPLGYVFLRSFTPILFLNVLAGIGRGFGKIGSGPAWGALFYDQMPSEIRGRVMALISITSDLIPLRSPLLVGAYLWSLNKELVPLTSVALIIIATLIFYKFVKDPQLTS